MIKQNSGIWGFEETLLLTFALCLIAISIRNIWKCLNLHLRSSETHCCHCLYCWDTQHFWARFHQSLQLENRLRSTNKHNLNHSLIAVKPPQLRLLKCFIKGPEPVTSSHPEGRPARWHFLSCEMTSFRNRSRWRCNNEANAVDSGTSLCTGAARCHRALPSVLMRLSEELAGRRASHTTNVSFES